MIDDDEVATIPQYSITRDRPRRPIKLPQRYAEADMVAYALNMAEDINADKEPSTYKEVISCVDSEKWLISMHKEIESLHKNGTWVLVKLPKGKKVIWCKQVFKRKEGTPGIDDTRYKVRLIAKGYSQISGVDYTDAFSPIVKHSFI